LGFIIISGDTSRCVQTESYLLRYGSLYSGTSQTLILHEITTGYGHDEKCEAEISER